MSRRKQSQPGPGGAPHKQRAAHPPALDPERQALAARAQRAQRCQQELNAILARYGCALQATQVWTNGQPGPLQIGVVALGAPAPQPNGVDELE